MKKLGQLNEELLEVIEKLRAGTISLPSAEALISAAETLVGTYELGRQYKKVEKDKPELLIEFMKDKGLEDLPSRDTVTFVRRVVEMARRELDSRAKATNPEGEPKP